MKNITDTVIADITDLIVNVRDFCGNEKQAAINALADDYNITGPDAEKAYRIANFRANALWNGYKKDAGVSAKYTF